jgi:hypothetical protein
MPPHIPRMYITIFALMDQYTYREPNITSFPNTIVTWELEKIEEDRTRLKLSHTGFIPGEIFRKHDEGWSHFLVELTKYCQKED